ncbi:MAG: universal stress protein [Saprospiraceae bacterium]|nr:universal stress protein [Saprospiraceae bacterium]
MQNMINDLMEITVLGTGSSSHQMVSFAIKKFLNSAEIPFVLKEETDIATFLQRELVSVPCVQIGDEFLPVQSNGNFNKSLRVAIKHILKKQNFGNMKKIIIPVDFSDVSTNAFMYGHRLATDLGAIVKALHVYLPTSKELYEATVVDVDFIELRKSKLENFVKDFDRDWGSDILATSIIDSEFRTGFPGEEIMDSLENNGAEMIIMGSTGDSGSIKKWFGSVSTKVMHESHCPVMLIPENAGYKGVHNILYAYDDIELDKKVIDQLVDFSMKFDAVLHLVHVNDDEKPNPGYYLEELFKEKYPDQKIKISTINSLDVVESIDEYAKSHNIDVISMGTKDRSFFDSIFHESITTKMALHSELPLLILKEH